MWDVKKAVAESPAHGQAWREGPELHFPQQFGYPHVCDTYWDPFWAFAQEANLPMNFHIGGGGGMGITADAFTGNNLKIQGAERSTRAVSANVDVMTTLLFSQIMERFPKLKVVSSESGLGWVPYLLETADHHWAQAKLAQNGMPLKPSEYFRRQCYVNFWFESVGLKLMKATFGVDNVMWSSDYPHPTGTWPDSKRVHREFHEGGRAFRRREAHGAGGYGAQGVQPVRVSPDFAAARRSSTGADLSGSWRLLPKRPGAVAARSWASTPSMCAINSPSDSSSMADGSMTYSAMPKRSKTLRIFSSSSRC